MTKIFEIEAEPFECCPAIGKIVKKTRADGTSATVGEFGSRLILLEPVRVFGADCGEAYDYEQWDDMLCGQLIIEYGGELFFVESSLDIVRPANVCDLPYVLMKEYMPSLDLTAKEIYRQLYNKGVRIFLYRSETVMLVDNEIVHVACKDAYNVMKKNGYLNNDGSLRKNKIGEKLLTKENIGIINELHRYAR